MTLYVTLTIHPGGDRSRARVVGEATIENVSELVDVSDYRYEIVEHDFEDRGLAFRSKGGIDGHKRSDGPWRLVARVLDEWRKR